MGRLFGGMGSNPVAMFSKPNPQRCGELKVIKNCSQLAGEIDVDAPSLSSAQLKLQQLELIICKGTFDFSRLTSVSSDAI